DVEGDRQRPVSERRVAGAQDLVAPEVHAELVLQRLREVDLGQRTEALALECVGQSFQHLVVARREVPLQGGVHATWEPCGDRKGSRWSCQDARTLQAIRWLLQSWLPPFHPKVGFSAAPPRRRGSPWDGRCGSPAASTRPGRRRNLCRCGTPSLRSDAISRSCSPGYHPMKRSCSRPRR